jgi:protein-L-isoaspartate(D-aspartate) O-methyltransferase
MLDLLRERRKMVDRQIARRGVSDKRVLDAMRQAPREAFVPEEYRDFAYDDTPLPIGAGQTISQPFIVAMMIEAAEVSPGERVLEIGAGSGYAAAVLSRIAANVYAIERHSDLAERAAERLARLGYDNVEVRAGDGTQGWPDAAPFDAILASAGGPAIPQTLKDQLGIGGHLVMPVGHTLREQRLMKVTRRSATSFEVEDLGGVVFVPLIGVHGWPQEDDRLRANPVGE